MKLKLKLVAIAAALSSLAGTASADLTAPGVENGSFSLLAFNTVTRDWYIRDLGYLINDFLPSTTTTLAGDGSVAGNKTPEAGLTIDGSVKSNFSDATFATWFAGQTAADVRWAVGSYDFVSSSGTQSQRRLLLSSKSATENFTNANLDSFTSSAQWGGLNAFFGTGTLSKTGTGIGLNADTGMQGGLDLTTLGTVGDSSNLYYVARSAFTGSSANSATITRFGNSENFASITLEADGDLIYSLAPAAAVPLPAAAWMMGAGLLGIGGMIRRRRAAALAA